MGLPCTPKRVTVGAFLYFEVITAYRQGFKHRAKFAKERKQMPPENVSTEEIITNPPGEESPELAAEVTESAPEDVPAGQEVEAAAEEEPKRDRVQERIDELTRKRREAERQADYYKGLAEGRTAKEPEPEPEPEPQASITRPNEGDFEDYSEYVVALADWRYAQNQQQAEAKRQAEAAKVKAQEANRQIAAWKQTGAGKFTDFADVVFRNPEDGGPAFSTEMMEVINASDMSHELAYHLGKHPEESYRIFNLSPLVAARELGKLEAKLSSIKPKTVSSAPDPIKPINVSNAGVDVPLEKMSEADFIAKRNREEFGPNWKG